MNQAGAEFSKILDISITSCAHFYGARGKVSSCHAPGEYIISYPYDYVKPALKMKVKTVLLGVSKGKSLKSD